MKSRQDYINTYREIAEGLNIYGDTAEILIQLLAESTYISEVENAVYMQEASLEKAGLMNSKIQHCMDDMYSVFRGSCPRVILRFHPTKFFDLKPFDELVVSSGFKIYYLGYLDEKGETGAEPETEITALMEGFQYGPKVIPPGLIYNPEEEGYEVYTVIGLLAKDFIQRSYTTDINNSYYVECSEEDLSSDLWVKINNEYFPVTRNFGDHIASAKVFDLTIPSFGSRLYVADILRDGRFSRNSILAPSNIGVEALWYKYSLLSDYNEAELRKIAIKGSLPVSFPGNEFRGSDELSPGLVVIDGSPRDTISTIHYRANRDRYVNSIIRTNSDIGIILEETFPGKIEIGGTSYRFTGAEDGNRLELFYIPDNENNLLTEEEINSFRENKSGYYVTSNITVTPGTKYTAVFNLDLELYQAESINDEIKNILGEYENKFNMNLEENSEEIKSLISKISNIKQISGYDIDYMDSNGRVLDDLGKQKMLEELETSYYKINYVINSKIQNIGL